MKLKTVSAPSIVEAMTQVRQTLGEEAVIVSSLRLPTGGIQLVVATEEKNTEDEIRTALAPQETAPLLSRIQTILMMHHVPPVIIERCLQSIRCNAFKTADEGLTAALAQTISFSPIGVTKTKRAFMLTGAPGVGKTIALVKWAVQASLERLKISILTLDMQKAGGTTQLKAFTDLLKIPLIILPDLSDFAAVVRAERAKSDFILIDTPGLNPWKVTDMALLAEVAAAANGIEPILVMPAGMDALESGETADRFAKLGCTRLIATRLDTSQTYGNIVNAAVSSGLSLAHYTTSAAVTEPLQSFSPDTLAGLLTHTSSMQEFIS
ncbi:MAG: hypothetical protein ACI4QM_03315 [Alphaproteobacteria bacterium]